MTISAVKLISIFINVSSMSAHLIDFTSKLSTEIYFDLSLCFIKDI